LISILEEFLRPSVLTLIATLTLPVFMIIKRKAFAIADRGYIAILVGSFIIVLAAFVDFFEETRWGSFLKVQFPSFDDHESVIVTLIFFPGILAIAWGISRWLPAVFAVGKEVERRQIAEEELKSLVDEMHSLAARAEEASRSKSEFLATMSHELRTPLNAVIGFTELMQEGSVNDDDTREEYLSIVCDSGRHLLSVINDILDLSKLDSGKAAVNVSSFSLEKLLKECEDYIATLAREKSLTIQLDCDDFCVNSDRKVVKQIILNLMSNAAKFTPEGGAIVLKGFEMPGGFEVSISDSGIGMTPEEAMRAVEPFVQIGNTLSRTIQGTGLGLSIVDRFTRLLGGRMAIHSEKGKGTTVQLSLPQLIVDNIDMSDMKEAI